MALDLTDHGVRQPLFGQFHEERMVEHQSHDGAVRKDNERKDQVKFLGGHDPFSAHIFRALQDEAPILKKYVAARDLMPVTRVRKAASVRKFCGLMTKVNPTRTIFGGRP